MNEVQQQAPNGVALFGVAEAFKCSNPQCGKHRHIDLQNKACSGCGGHSGRPVGLQLWGGPTDHLGEYDAVVARLKEQWGDHRVIVKQNTGGDRDTFATIVEVLMGEKFARLDAVAARKKQVAERKQLIADRKKKAAGK